MPYAVSTIAAFGAKTARKRLQPAPDHPATVCAWCGKVRTAADVWQRITCDQQCCSHSACPDCYQKTMLALYEELRSFDS